jgi:hypothetical protein
MERESEIFDVYDFNDLGLALIYFVSFSEHFRTVDLSLETMQKNPYWRESAFRIYLN